MLFETAMVGSLKIYCAGCRLQEILRLPGPQRWVKENMDQVQQIYLLSNYILATSTGEIPFMEGYFESRSPDYNHDPSGGVIDRTGEVVHPSKWEVNQRRIQSSS